MQQDKIAVNLLKIFYIIPLIAAQISRFIEFVIINLSYKNNETFTFKVLRNNCKAYTLSHMIW